ncbi:hypothetical protein Q3G72_006144 [Acer saccharum]|nr:hypothetical protein Q3G72_006144 [Acer saccharum]
MNSNGSDSTAKQSFKESSSIHAAIAEDVGLINSKKYDFRLISQLKIHDSKVEDFYEDPFEELNKYGEIECLNVCDNLADHMVGNVYFQFKEDNIY